LRRIGLFALQASREELRIRFEKTEKEERPGHPHQAEEKQASQKRKEPAGTNNRKASTARLVAIFDRLGLFMLGCKRCRLLKATPN